MQSLMGGTPMANAPSNLGVSAGPSAPSTAAISNGLKPANPPLYSSAEAAANAQGLVYPALHLHPLNDTFAPKQISLAPPGPNNRIKIGRQTNAKTVPNPTNGYFDSKVLSRMHAEVWSQNGKVYIKDVKSSNGTFINGERLSPEAQESDVFELHSEDMVEFGIDIVGDDNKTIIHHKVACRVYLVLTAEDALSLRHDFASLYRGGMHGGPLGSNGVGPGAEGGLRRTKAGFSFDHVLSKLQSELQRSKEQWNDLGSLNATMNDIHETLGGGAPPLSSAPYPHLVPPLPGAVNPQQQQEQQEQQRAKDAETQAATEAHSATISALQAQLSETQSSLAAHVEKIRSLESVLSEQDSIKREVSTIKMQMEEARREMDAVASASGSSFSSRHGLNGFGTIRGGSNFGRSLEHDDFDDGASVASVETITQSNDDEESSTHHHIGPRAPPDMPAHLLSEDAADLESSRAPQVTSAHKLGASAAEAALASTNDERDVELRAQNEALSARLDELAAQLEQALALSRGLQDQHAQVTDTVKTLEQRVHSLEQEVEQKASPAAPTAGSSEETTAALLKGIEGRWTEFRSDFEESWRKEREGMQTERDELRQVVQAWDEANRRMEDELNRDASGESDEHGQDGGSVTARSPQLDASQEHGSASNNVAGPSSLLASSSAPSSRSKRGNGRRNKRHVNSALRSLLYGSSSAGLLHEADARGSEDDERWGLGSRARLSHSSPDDDALSASHSVRSIADSTSTRPSTSTEVTTPDLGPEATRGDAAGLETPQLKQNHGFSHTRHGRDGGGDNTTGRSAQERVVGPQTLAAAGVVFVGLTAWILAGKDLARLGAALPGKP
ncbi:Forkhead-associated (FHA) domain protein [Kalmanozyma brasiliensis GHG001]|uniref:FHA domain-containing protein n=1 Tax=Kalmanozyma brasiliensis (strain GHG001) TaxID=1365824 RepID=V5GTW5_KALBG|nr:Forkhead-associated (FHA) domain protein [Kalmanozyma brasiliensis GHG001]EST09352.1 Forkhead-associated (FHA) domain protein [Kalmanozyma brasiliensis GHG001]